MGFFDFLKTDNAEGKKEEIYLKYDYDENLVLTTRSEESTRKIKIKTCPICEKKLDGLDITKHNVYFKNGIQVNTEDFDTICQNCNALIKFKENKIEATMTEGESEKYEDNVVAPGYCHECDGEMEIKETVENKDYSISAMVCPNCKYYMATASFHDEEKRDKIEKRLEFKMTLSKLAKKWAEFPEKEKN